VTGEEIHAVIADLYPICRSITGDGVRETLARLQRLIPLSVGEVPTGTPVFDWTVPKEWNIREAWIRDPRGQKVVDFADSNLHVVSYSVPIHQEMSLDELAGHVHTLPDHPDWIPYRTSYYEEVWGFCMEHRRFQDLPEGRYEVRIDSTLDDGHLTYAELLLPGELDDEILFSAHVCHPSLCNDNLSGVAVAAHLARALQDRSRRYSYRFVFAPVTIGAITWLATHEEEASRIRHGLVLACVGDSGGVHYKRTRHGAAEVDRAVEHVLGHRYSDAVVEDFTPYGYDERQYGSPGFDLAVGRLSRTPHGRFPEYHTSADDLTLVRPESLQDSLEACMAVVDVLERNRAYVNVNPKCEPQLGKRGLMGSLGGGRGSKGRHMALLWVLNLSDGSHDLLAIAERSGLEFGVVAEAAAALVEADLLAPA
jgi:aminopeptidase-like protein